MMFLNETLIFQDLKKGVHVCTVRQGLTAGHLQAASSESLKA